MYMLNRDAILENIFHLLLVAYKDLETVHGRGPLYVRVGQSAVTGWMWVCPRGSVKQDIVGSSCPPAGHTVSTCHCSLRSLLHDRIQEAKLKDCSSLDSENSKSRLSWFYLDLPPQLHLPKQFPPSHSLHFGHLILCLGTDLSPVLTTPGQLL